MAVYQGNGPPTILACNANSDRGWNDPPTLAFASPTSSTSTPRKRLDLRKRVAHDCISGPGINTGMANLSLGQNPPNQNIHGQQNTYYQSQNYKPSTPNVNSTYPPLYNPSASQPPSIKSSLNPYEPTGNGHPQMPNAYGGHSQMPMSGSMTPPVLMDQHHSTHLPHAASMPNLHRSLSASPQPPMIQNIAPPIFSVNNPSQQVATVGESSAVSGQTSSAAIDPFHVGQPLVNFSAKNTSSAIGDLGNGSYQPVPPIPVERINEQAQMNKTVPSLSTEYYEHPHHVRSNSLPDFKPIMNGPPPVTAPPVEGYYASKSSSACASRQRTPSPLTNQTGQIDQPVSKGIDLELYTNIMDQLQFALDKCSVKLEKRLYDDVKRKLDVLGQQWTSEKFSQDIINRIVSMTEAISNGNYVEANRVQQSLIVDYSSEVSQWMVGIKKIIITCENL
ncbi:uncharacterized protein LOC135686015 [Rhopilema esculentum]|uniref:uncharacterized protein LOC135686015 n=1 Tax=Rhopilema esculentum TaxID=499914 RepID=UPI0031D1B56A